MNVDIPSTPSPSFEPPDSPVKALYNQPLVPNLGLITDFVAMAYPASSPQPTQAEINREYFVGKFEGSYTVAAGRFGYQAVTIHGASVNGGTNQSATPGRNSSSSRRRRAIPSRSPARPSSSRKTTSRRATP